MSDVAAIDWGKGHSEGACHERMGGKELTTVMGRDYFGKGGW
jgi:hypothetical protein